MAKFNEVSELVLIVGFSLWIGFLVGVIAVCIQPHH